MLALACACMRVHCMSFGRNSPGTLNYPARLRHLVEGQGLLEAIGYDEDDKGQFLVLPIEKYQKSELGELKRVRDLVYDTLQRLTKEFQELAGCPCVQSPSDVMPWLPALPPMQAMAPHLGRAGQFERAELKEGHEWSSCRFACEAHDIGRRGSMEDDHLLIDSFCGVPTDGFWGVYDGHGGRATVDFLTCSLHRNLAYYVHKNPKVPMRKVFEDVYAITDKQMAATLHACLSFSPSDLSDIT